MVGAGSGERVMARKETMERLTSGETEICLFDITFGDFLIFINWIDHSERALNHAEPLPPPPHLTSTKILEWVHLILRLEERARQAEERIRSAEATALEQEIKLGQFLSSLHVSIASLYEHLGETHKAAKLRRKVDALPYG